MENAAMGLAPGGLIRQQTFEDDMERIFQEEQAAKRREQRQEQATEAKNKER